MARAFYYCFWIEFNWRSKPCLWDGQYSNFLHTFVFDFFTLLFGISQNEQMLFSHLFATRDLSRENINRIKQYRSDKASSQQILFPFYVRMPFVCLCVSKTPSRLQFNDCYHRFKHSTDNELYSKSSSFESEKIWKQLSVRSTFQYSVCGLYWVFEGVSLQKFVNFDAVRRKCCNKSK